jgi:hypothetical protein
VLHGLRKAAARRLAEAGCTEKEIAAVTGHTTLKEVARYTRAAEQKRLAAGALAKLTEQKAGREFPTPQQVWENLAAISSVVHVGIKLCSHRPRTRIYDGRGHPTYRVCVADCASSGVEKRASRQYTAANRKSAASGLNLTLGAHA